MTEREFLQRLADDQEITAARAEDILQALNDMVSEALASGERVNLRLGQFEIRPVIRDGQEKPVVAVRFRPSAELRARLKLADLKWDSGEFCVDCGKRPRKKYPRCATCHNKKYPGRGASRCARTRTAPTRSARTSGDAKT